MTNVLLVDDDENLLDIAKTHLENHEPSFMVTTSTSGRPTPRRTCRCRWSPDPQNKWARFSKESPRRK
ncbi:MAG: hypothetical protein ACXAEI_20665 [Candidatus Hodarchaeales archaeon]